MTATLAELYADAEQWLLESPALHRAGASSTAHSATGDSWPRRGVLGRLGEPRGSAPGDRRPVLVVSSDRSSACRIRTVIVAAVMTDQRGAAAPGNVPLVVGTASLERCTVNASQLMSVNRTGLAESVGSLDSRTIRHVDDGARLMRTLG